MLSDVSKLCGCLFKFAHSGLLVDKSEFSRRRRIALGWRVECWEFFV